MTPRWQRGGSILPRRERTRRSALLARWDPITLHVAPDANGSASGILLIEDGESDAHGWGGAHTGGAHTGGAHTGGARTGGAHTGGAHTGGAHTGAAHTGGWGGAILELKLECEGGGCVLRSTPRPSGGAGVGAGVGDAPTRAAARAIIPEAIHVERVLIRIPRASVYAQGAPPEVSLRVEGALPVRVEARWSDHGVVVERMRAPCLQTWQLVARGLAQALTQL